MNLIEQLRLLGDDTESKCPDLNYGGCGVYAALVGRRLIELGVRSVRSRVSGFNWWGQPMPRNLGQSWMDESFSLTHVALTFAWDGTLWTHDSQRTMPGLPKKLMGAPVYEGALTIGKTIRLANTGHWNEQFDRPSGISLIKHNIERYLKHEYTYTSSDHIGGATQLKPRSKRVAYPDVRARYAA